MPSNIITSSHLLETYLTKSMEKYFYRKLKNENEEYIKLKISELLKFLALSHHTYGDIPFNEEIDEIWHLWILQTVQYRELMDKLPNKLFINHCSHDYINEENQILDECNEIKFNRQISYLASYVANFGDFTDETAKFWPMTKTLMRLMNFDMIDLNRYLKNLLIEETASEYVS